MTAQCAQDHDKRKSMRIQITDRKTVITYDRVTLRIFNVHSYPY